MSTRRDRSDFQLIFLNRKRLREYSDFWVYISNELCSSFSFSFSVLQIFSDLVVESKKSPNLDKNHWELNLGVYIDYGLNYIRGKSYTT